MVDRGKRMLGFRSLMTWSNVRLAFMGGILIGASLLSLQQAGATRDTNLGSRSAVSGAAQPYWSKANIVATGEGHIGFSDRPKSVQAILQAMYASDTRYQSFSGLFVDATPGSHQGSIRIAIDQPRTVTTAVYSSVDGSGRPVEVTRTNQIGIQFFAPGANLSAQEQLRVPGGRLPALPPLASVPLGVMAGQGSATGVESLADPAGATVANMFLHPSTLITSPFFTNKEVSVGGRAVYEGRPVWVLVGKQVPGAQQLGSLGDGWRMFVDQASGVVLQVQYMSGDTVTGVGKFVDVAIGSDPATLPFNGETVVNVPSNAREVDGPTFEKAVSNAFQ